MALLLLYPGSTSGDAGAHGGGTEIFRGVDGPFVIAVRILPLQPLVGKLHLTVTVDLLETGESVGDARVRVTGHHQTVARHVVCAEVRGARTQDLVLLFVLAEE